MMSQIYYFSIDRESIYIFILFFTPVVLLMHLTNLIKSVKQWNILELLD